MTSIVDKYYLVYNKEDTLEKGVIVPTYDSVIMYITNILSVKYRNEIKKYCKNGNDLEELIKFFDLKIVKIPFYI